MQDIITNEYDITSGFVNAVIYKFLMDTSTMISNTVLLCIKNLIYSHSNIKDINHILYKENKSRNELFTMLIYSGWWER